MRRVWLVAVALALSLPAAARADPVASRYFDEDRGLFSFAKVLEHVLPSVVQIEIVAAPDAAAKEARSGAKSDPDSGERAIVSGSGVVIDAAKGYVLTNNHVVTAEGVDLKGPTAVKVGLRDGREFTGQVVGQDALTDIALVRIPADHLNAIEIGDSASLAVGDVVLAVGYPLGLDQSVTFGVVSGLRRHLDDKRLEDFIQTDAAVNHGNSGGPLVDSRGRLVGINTAIANPYGEGNIGLNFAVPTRIAMSVTVQLERYGVVHRGRAGIVAADLTPPLAAALGAPVDHGALIREVEPGEPAAEAGLRAGDIVVSAGESEVLTTNDLRTIIGLAETGDSIALHFYRDGHERQVTVVIAPEPTLAAVVAETLSAAPGKADQTSLFGATFRAMPADHPLHGKMEGVVVVAVAANSPAESQGLRAGDVVVKINKKPTRDIAAFKAAVAAATEAIAMQVVRGATTRIAVFARTKPG